MGRKRALQWHPAFFAALKAMEEKEQCSLQIQREYNLGTKPRQIDVLITKNDQKNEMQNSKGRCGNLLFGRQPISDTDYCQPQAESG